MNGDKLSVLLLDDNADDAILIARKLARLATLKVARNRAEFLKSLEQPDFDLVLIDYKLGDIHGLEALKIMKAATPDIPAMIVTGTVGEEAAAETIKAGASDFVLKENLDRLPRAVETVIKAKQDEAKLYQAQRTQSLGALAAGIVHDLNNCLTSPVMALSMLSGSLTGDQRELVNISLASLQRAHALGRQLMAFVRGTDGGRQLVSLKNQLSSILQMARQTFPSNIQAELSTQEADVDVIGNPTQLFQVVLNLCINARDAMPNGGSLTLGLSESVLDGERVVTSDSVVIGRYARITITDTGIGIEQETIPKLFNLFYTTKGADKGTGLGLATALQIVKQHGGYIDVRSELGSGSTFTVLLPICDFSKIR